MNGMSYQLVLLKVLVAGQYRELVMRWSEKGESREALEKEYKLLKILFDKNILVPEVYFQDYSKKLFRYSYMIMSYIDGEPDFKLSQKNLVQQMASFLAHIHLETFHNEFLISQSFKDIANRELSHNIKSPNNTLSEAEIRKKLLSFDFNEINTPTLLHGDYWPGNILWRNGKLVGVVDWEDSFLGNPLYDLAIARLELSWIFSLDIMDEFTRAYLSLNNLNISQLAFWDLWAALRFIRLTNNDLSQWTHFFHKQKRFDVTEKSILNCYSSFISQAFEKL